MIGRRTPSGPKPYSRRAAPYFEQARDVAGWFPLLDALLFDVIAGLQRQEGTHGDMLEIGVYKGRSAILLGYLLDETERLFACDLFGSAGPTGDDPAEQDQYGNRVGMRGVFESNYGRFHEKAPVVLECASQELPSRLAGGTFRFIHIDGSHQYEAVRNDLATARLLLADDGLVAVDDYRGLHTPGVAAAVWDEVTNRGFAPLCITEQKLYGAWQEPARAREVVERLRPRVADLPGAITRAHKVGEHVLFDARLRTRPTTLQRMRRGRKLLQTAVTTRSKNLRWGRGRAGAARHPE